MVSEKAQAEIVSKMPNVPAGVSVKPLFPPGWTIGVGFEVSGSFGIIRNAFLCKSEDDLDEAFERLCLWLRVYLRDKGLM